MEHHTIRLGIHSLFILLSAVHIAVAEDDEKPCKPIAVHQVGERSFAPMQEAPHPIQQLSAAPADNVVLPAAATDNRDALLQQKTRELERLQAEIQQLRSGMGLSAQILVRVEMLEVSLTKMRKAGFETPSLSNGCLGAAELAELQTALTKNLETSNQPYTPPKTVTPTSYMDWLVQNNFGKILARPTMVVVSGRPGSFFVGNEIPVPSRPDSKGAVDFQKCGTELDVVAIAKDTKHVRMELRARVSELDASRSVTVNGTNVPALNVPALIVRQCDTALEATFGEPMVLNGLIETRTEAQKTDKGIRNVDNEIMLMIVVIPELVEPLVSAQPQPAAHNRK